MLYLDLTIFSDYKWLPPYILKSPYYPTYPAYRYTLLGPCPAARPTLSPGQHGMARPYVYHGGPGQILKNQTRLTEEFDSNRDYNLTEIFT